MTFDKENNIDPVDATSDGADVGEMGFVSSEPKKQVSPGVMVIGGLLIVAAAVFYFQFARKGPAKAAASTTGEANTTITQYLSTGDQNAQNMRQMLRETEKVVDQFRNNDPVKTQIPADDLKTNPFSEPYAARAGEKPEPDAAARKRKEELLKAAQGLKLQSVIHGSKKTAMINGAPFQEGQEVGEFTVEKIGPNSVIIRADKSRFELKIRK